MIVQRALELASVTLDILPLREERVRALALGAVRGLELRDFVKNVRHFAPGARTVEEQVVIGEAALERAHLVAQRLVPPLERAIRRVLRTRRVRLPLEARRLLVDGGAARAQLSEEEVAVLDLTTGAGARARGGRAAHPLLRDRPVRDGDRRVHPLSLIHI